MILRTVQRELLWPDHIQVAELRQWLLLELGLEEQPLRWAITAVFQGSDGRRRLQVEAVLIG
ncbi:MAG: hypothetical protein CL862_03760 [Cyanobium sp. NAT70]|nr:hypothetical protein [Cyanobium sp. NAT70]